MSSIFLPGESLSPTDSANNFKEAIQTTQLYEVNGEIMQESDYNPVEHEADFLVTGSIRINERSDHPVCIARVTSLNAPPQSFVYKEMAKRRGERIPDFYEGVAIATTSRKNTRDFVMQIQIGDHTLDTQSGQSTDDPIHIESHFNLQETNFPTTSETWQGLNFLMREMTQEDSLQGGLINTATRLLKNNATLQQELISGQIFSREAKAVNALIDIQLSQFRDIAKKYIDRLGNSFLGAVSRPEREEIIANTVGVFTAEAIQAGMLRDDNEELFYDRPARRAYTYADALHARIRQGISRQIDRWGYGEILSHLSQRQRVVNAYTAAHLGPNAVKIPQWYNVGNEGFNLALTKHIITANRTLGPAEIVGLIQQTIKEIHSFQNRLASKKYINETGEQIYEPFNPSLEEQPIKGFESRDSINSYLRFLGVPELPSYIRWE